MILIGILWWAGCSEPTAVLDPTVGALRIDVRTAGPDSEPKAYTLLVGAEEILVPVNGSHLIDSLNPGAYRVALLDVPDNCSPSTFTHDVTVVAGDTAGVAFEVQCVSAVGAYRIMTRTDGFDVPSQHTVIFDDSLVLSMEVADTLFVSDVPVGPHHVRLSELARNCTLFGDRESLTYLQFRDTVSVSYAIECFHDFDRVGSLRWAPDSRSLFFQGRRDGGGWKIYELDVATSALRQVIGLAGNEEHPSLSPSGDSVAFSYNSVYVFDRLTGDTLRISGFGAVPAWSPDGGWIALHGYEDSRWNIYIVHPDGTGFSRVTNGALNEIDAGYSFSPGGARLLFTRGANLFTVDLGGTNLVQVTSGGVSGGGVWSPDGTRIVVRMTPSGTADVFVLVSDGSGLTQLTTDPAHDTDPLWSPDGTRISFESWRDGNWEIYVMAPDGSGQVNLTNSPDADETSHLWSPDGSMIACLAHVSAGYATALFVMNADGTGRRRL